MGKEKERDLSFFMRQLELDVDSYPAIATRFLEVYLFSYRDTPGGLSKKSEQVA